MTKRLLPAAATTFARGILLAALAFLPVQMLPAQEGAPRRGGAAAPAGAKAAPAGAVAQPGQPANPGDPAAAGAKTEEKKAPEGAKTIPRPAAPPKPANPEELKVRPDADGNVAFNFQGQPWLGVLQWLAEISNLSLDWQELPDGFLNLHTQQKYNLEEARDLLNRHLLDRKFTLLKQGEVLTLVSIKNLDPSLVRRLRPDELDSVLPHDFVRVLFPLDWLKAETAAEELKSLLSPNGKLTALKSTNRLEGIDAASNLRDIRDLLNEEQSGKGRERLVKPFKLVHARASDVLEQLQDLLGIEKAEKGPQTPAQMARQQQMMQQMQQQQQQGGAKPPGMKEKPEIYLVVNPRENSILANAPADHMAKIEEAIKALDVPIDTSNSLLRNPGRMQIYRPTGIDPELLVKMLEQVGGLDAATRLQVDKKNQTVVADASLADHLTIRRLLDNFNGADRTIYVIKLKRLGADYVAGTIEFMFGAGDKDKQQQQNRNPYMYLYGMMPQQNAPESETKKFRVEADVENNRLLVYANDVEYAEIQNLLAKLGEMPSSGGGSGATMRVLDSIDPAEAEEILRRMQKTWESVAPNPLHFAPGVKPSEKPRPAAESDPAGQPRKPQADKASLPSADRGDMRHAPRIAGAEREIIRLVQLEKEAASPPEHAAETAQADRPIGSSVPDGEAAPAFENPLLPRRGPLGAKTPTQPPEAAPIRIGRSPDGRLVIASEDANALDQFEEMLLEMSPARRDYKLFRMKHNSTSALYVSWNLEDYFKEDKKDGSRRLYDIFGFPANSQGDSTRRLSKRKVLKFISDSDTNSILVVGADEQQLKVIQDLIDFYDVPESRDPQAVRHTKLVPIKFSKAKIVADAVKEVYRDLLSVNDPALQNQNNNQKEKRSESAFTTVINYGQAGDEKKREPPMKFKGLLSLGVDEVSNTVVISAAEGLLATVEATVKALDEAARPTVSRMQVLQVGRQVDSEELQRRLQKLTAPKPKPQPQPGQPQQPGQPAQEEAQNGGRQIIRNFNE